MTVTADEATDTVTLTAADLPAIQKAANELVAGGYFGQCSHPDIKLTADTRAKGEKVQTLTIEGVHLCCGACVSAVDKAVKKVPGVTGHTAKRKAKSFEVTGNFNDKDVFEALQKAGFNGRVGK